MGLLLPWSVRSLLRPGIPFVSLDDLLHQFVAHHVLVGEGADTDALHPSSTCNASTRPLVLPPGRSIWVMSPVMTILEPRPYGSETFSFVPVVFCASSRMMKASFKVRPAYRPGRHLHRVPLQQALIALAPHHVVQGVVQAQIGVYLLLQIPGKKAQFFSRFHRRAGSG